MTDGFSRVLYQSDGTNAGTTPASFNNGVTIAKTSYSVYQDQPFAIAQSSIFFAGSTSATGAELYKYNASNSAGAVLVKDIAPGTISSVLVTEAIRSMNDSIYFVTPDFSGTVYSLWKSGGTVASTNALKTLSGKVNSFYAIGKKLYFSTTSDANGFRTLGKRWYIRRHQIAERY